MVNVPINHKVLKWARDFRGLSVEEAADKIGVSIDELLAYEAGKQFPNLTRFEKFANVYQLPQATLFRRTPPKEPRLPSDFRTFEGAPPHFSFAFHVALSEVRVLQRNLRNLSKDDDEFRGADLPAYERQRDPWTQGEQERERIGVSIQEQLNWHSNEGFRRWRAILEERGIGVYLQKFELRDCRGFSLFEDDFPPGIVINKAEDYDRARTFTLIHEYAHLLIRRPGISDQNSRDPTEAFCSRFAAAFLMPTAALRAVLSFWPNKPENWERDYIRRCATRLKVSQQALALRLEEMGLAPPGFYSRFVWKGKDKKEISGGGGGNYVVTRLNEIGGQYMFAIIGALDRQIIDPAHAAEALGLAADHFETVRQSIERQRTLVSGE